MSEPSSRRIEPFKGLLLGVFFFSVGMSLDLAVVLANPLWVLGGTAVLIAVKARVHERAAVRAAGYPVSPRSGHRR